MDYVLLSWWDICWWFQAESSDDCLPGTDSTEWNNRTAYEVEYNLEGKWSENRLPYLQLLQTNKDIDEFSYETHA